MTEKHRLTEGRVAFLARRDDILRELEKGWSTTAVYRQFAPQLPIGLRQFQIYVRRYLIEKALPPFVSSANKRPTADVPPPAPQLQTCAPLSPTAPKPIPSSPAFGPVGKINPEDLY